MLSPTLCDPMDCSASGSSAHVIFQQEYWRGLPFPAPGDLPDPGIEPVSSASRAFAGGFFTTEPPEKTKGIRERRKNLRKINFC